MALVSIRGGGLTTWVIFFYLQGFNFNVPLTNIVFLVSQKNATFATHIADVKYLALPRFYDIHADSLTFEVRQHLT